MITNIVPEFVKIFAGNLTKSLTEYVYADVRYYYDYTHDNLIITLQLNDDQFKYTLADCMKKIMHTTITIKETRHSILRAYKKSCLLKFFKLANLS